MASRRVYGYVAGMPWVVGDFIWTAMDYLGETAIGAAIATERRGRACCVAPSGSSGCTQSR